jgi:hypothetical protein
VDAHPQNPRDDHLRYVEAARRQVEICRYHARRLNEVLDGRKLAPGAVDVDIQAYFDGAVSAVVAAHDKATEALLIAGGFSQGVNDTENRAARVKDALSLLSGSLRRKLSRWRDDRWDDVHDLRVRIVHHNTIKRAEDGLLQVYVIRPDGQRELREYTQIAVELMDDFVPILDALEDELQEIASGKARTTAPDR